MKKIFNLILTVLVVFFITAIQSCKEDDTPPTITLIGSADTTIAQGSTYIDPGATAEDDKDDVVNVINDYSATNPDESVPRDYTITYKAQDRNANSSRATRIVSVTWVGTSLASGYVVTDTSQVDTLGPYPCTVIQNPLNPFQVDLYGLSDGTGFSIASNVYANLKGNKATITSQQPDGPGTNIISGYAIISDNPPPPATTLMWDIHYTIRDTMTPPSFIWVRHAVMAY